MRTQDDAVEGSQQEKPIQPNDSVELLHQRVQNLRLSIALEMMECDDLVLREIPKAAYEYGNAILEHESDLISAEAEMLKARRRFEMAREAQRDGRLADAKQIEDQIDHEVSKWIKRIKKTRKFYKLGNERKDIPAGVSEAEALWAESKSLETMLSALNRRLRDLNEGEPLCYGEKLKDPVWVANCVEEVDDTAREYRDAAIDYNARFEALMIELKD